MMTPVIDPDRRFIVVNPVSGGGRALRFRPWLTAALERAGLAYECVFSGAPDDATRRFAGAVDEGCRRLLAVGGDGTFNELINGLQATTVPSHECLVAAAAGGTGNDWSRAMQVPDDPGPLVACMARGRALAYLLGLARTLAAYRAPQFEVSVDGRLAGDPAFRVVRCRSATIRCETPCGVELDGQEFGATPLTVTVRPGALRALDCRDLETLAE